MDRAVNTTQSKDLRLLQRRFGHLLVLHAPQAGFASGPGFEIGCPLQAPDSRVSTALSLCPTSKAWVWAALGHRPPPATSTSRHAIRQGHGRQGRVCRSSQWKAVEGGGRRKTADVRRPSRGPDPHAPRRASPQLSTKNAATGSTCTWGCTASRSLGKP